MMTKSVRTLYWATTGIIALLMLIGGLCLLLWPVNKELIRQLGFPAWFATELGVAKLIGVVVLVVPQIPARVKEWAYAGFAIVLVSAALAHFNHGDPLWRASEPLGFLLVLLVSNRTLHKLARAEPV